MISVKDPKIQNDSSKAVKAYQYQYSGGRVKSQKYQRKQ